MLRDSIAALIDTELDLARGDLDVTRPGVSIERSGLIVLVHFETCSAGVSGTFALDCSLYDVDPPSVSMVDMQGCSSLPIEAWTPGVPHSLHPVSNRPFVCAQGIAEYHTHPSHVADSWDRYRNRFRLPQTIGFLLNKAGVPR
jgi:hypothetical protein